MQPTNTCMLAKGAKVVQKYYDCRNHKLPRDTMEYFIGIAVIALIIFGIVKAIGTNPYENMTSEEFEAEAKRRSPMGAAAAALQKVVDPSHRVEYVQEQKERAEAGVAKSGDRPETGPSAPLTDDER